MNNLIVAIKQIFSGVEKGARKRGNPPESMLLYHRVKVYYIELQICISG